MKPLPEPLETLRIAYAEACERIGHAHANGTRPEWEAAVRDEIEARAALYDAIRAAIKVRR